MYLVEESVRHVMAVVHENRFQSVAVPLIGAGLGGLNQEQAKALTEDKVGRLEYPMKVRVVVYRRQGTALRMDVGIGIGSR